jgi:epoxyqueuosine reductase
MKSQFVMQSDMPFGSVEEKIRSWALALGFSAVGVSGASLNEAKGRLAAWLEKGFHGEMHYMAKHASLRSNPELLYPGAVNVISVAMNYLVREPLEAWHVLDDPEKAYVSRYALGRDYHKVLRGKLKALAERIGKEFGADCRVFTDSAPVMEVEFAKNSGLGWRGKHTLLLGREQGSFFFLGEIYTNLSLKSDGQVEPHCGICEKCIDICPTGAIVEPYVLDARRCISYLTIEHPGSIPVEFRKAIGNRIYGCDDCQLVCPWNKFAKMTFEVDFSIRNGLDSAGLAELFAWTADEFDSRLAGSAIRRIGHERWLRNIAVALGNAPCSIPVINALESNRYHESGMVREHVLWALAQHLR